MYMDSTDDVIKSAIATAKHGADDPQEPKGKKTRVVVFGSFYRGYNILYHLLHDKELMERIEIVGVATDDPTKPGVSAKKRVWQYPHTREEETMVEDLAKRHNIPVYSGKVKCEEFYDLLKNKWQPDIVYMGTFGQLLNEEIINAVPKGIFNCHPGDGEKWPSMVGPNPFEQLFEAKGDRCAIALHKANPRFDDGELTCFSERIVVPYDDMSHMSTGEKVVYMHKITSPYAGRLVDAHLRSQIEMPLSKHQAYYMGKFNANGRPADTFADRLNDNTPASGNKSAVNM